MFNHLIVMVMLLYITVIL